MPKTSILLWLSLTALGCGNATTNGTPDLPDLSGVGPCAAAIEEAPDDPGLHVVQGTPLTPSTNPPAAGPHYPVWAPYAQVFPDVVPRGNWLHSAEHGAVILLYDPAECGGDCAALAARLGALGQALPQDPLCQRPINARWLVTADPLLPAGTAVAAVGWRFLYRARCLDEASLSAFISARYARGPENLCNDGAIAWR